MTVEVTARVAAFDRLRGLLMVLMVLDHTAYFVGRVHPAETWASAPPYYADVVAFVTRWITHLCAPGFFLLMGAGAALFAHSRVAAGWSSARITRFLATRGLVLLVVQHVVENPAWLIGSLPIDPAVQSRLGSMPGPGGDVMLNFGVLSALGVALLVCSVAWRWHRYALIAVALLSWRIATDVIGAQTDPAASQSVLMQLLFVPSVDGPVQVLYPWVVWCFPALLGVQLGTLVATHGVRVVRELRWMPLVMLAGFVLLRWWDVHDGTVRATSVMEFLTITKYPPDHAFFAVTIGLNFALLVAMKAWSPRWMQPLETFGRAPFFFYIAHLYVLAPLGWLFPSGASFLTMYLVWAGAVLLLYPACRRYIQFKFSKPETSLWRMF